MTIPAASLNETHDPAAKSWVASANAADCDFPLQNLPFAVFRRRAAPQGYRGGVAIGDQIVDLEALSLSVVFDGDAALALRVACLPTLNALMALGPRYWAALRRALFGALRESSPLQTTLINCLIPQAEAEYALPAVIGDFTDFYASIHHATAVGRLFRPGEPLLPNYRWMPIAYHGRSSSVLIGGRDVRRPAGQSLPAGAVQPLFGPSRRLDYELEVGVYVGTGNALGVPIPLDDAEGHIFGLCLLNDWSARDLQAWEYQPLGPFLSKSFATTVSPWIVTMEAVAPFRAPSPRPAADPPPLAYLASAAQRAAGAIDMVLEAHLQSARMRELGLAPQRLSRTNFRHCYWTIAQMLAHHASNGCNLRPGDLFGSGTQSGPAAEEAGSLLELTAGGKREITLSSGETRGFLQDGDRLILRGWCERAGFARIGCGSAAAEILPAPEAAQVASC